ncbi:MAG: Mut7-C RNAse domain-containing protein [Chthoniobacterales bacterium]
MRDVARENSFAVTLRFRGDLPFFLKRSEAPGPVIRRLREKTAVKDVIEACGVPHTEVDLILCNGVPRTFTFHLLADTTVEIYPVRAADELHSAHRLQRRQVTRFVVDGHLGKLARDLRLLGFDALYSRDARDDALLRAAIEQQRALLTRDRRLLMHAVLRDGYCPRSDQAEEQIVEVVRRFELKWAMRPYTRCSRCNGILQRVAKESVVTELEPLTRIYYEEFRQCVDCRNVYWSGSHFAKLQARLERICARVAGHADARNQQ